MENYRLYFDDYKLFFHNDYESTPSVYVSNDFYEIIRKYSYKTGHKKSFFENYIIKPVSISQTDLDIIISNKEKSYNSIDQLWYIDFENKEDLAKIKMILC